MESILTKIDHNADAALERLFELLKLQSISTDPAYKEACRTTAEWLASDLNGMGFDASLRETPGHPMVVAHYNGPGPHILFYGHYDVQPVDPLELWKRPPFEPALLDTENGPVIHGRGSSDDKGQLMTFIEACRSYKDATGALPCKITIFLEGEEESGSPSLVPFMKENAKELKADIALICDTGMIDAQTPCISSSLRGLLGEELIITGPNRDLHSGLYGGAAMNPARVLARILAGLHDENGAVTLDGFYDGVPEISADILKQWESLGRTAETFLGPVGLSALAGENDRSLLEQIWARPTCEINGLNAGYTGEGFKTVLPSKASAKVSFRLVGTQDPHKIRKTFRAYVEAQLPEDCTVEFKDHGASSGSVMNTSSPFFEKARLALSQDWPNEAVFVGMGGSIPIAGYFKSILDMDALLIGFALEDDNIHSPNEKYNLESFQNGTKSWARILNAFTKG